VPAAELHHEATTQCFVQKQRETVLERQKKINEEKLRTQ
jgi:hypothetical protein